MAIAAHQAQAAAAAAAAHAASSPGAATFSSAITSGTTNNSSIHATDRAKTPTRDGLPPAPIKFDASQAQACRLQDAYWSEEEEDMDCPLCLEEIDLSDANFKPCPCGYQICRFCWHHIKQNLNGRCPACRRKYSDQTIEFKPMTAEEIKRLTQAKKQKERERKELEQMNRKHLANMRVVQKNLVYVVGLNSKLAKEELIPTLRSSEYFGQYGRISKILISKRTTASKLVMGTQDTSIGVYVTYVRKEDAARAIVAIDGTKGSDGKIIRASYGTTKYCTTYLRNLPCNNPACTYLHEPGEEADSFTKEDLSTLRHAAKDTEHRTKPAGHGLAFATQRGTGTGTNQAGDPAAVAAAAAAANAAAAPGGVSAAVVSSAAAAAAAAVAFASDSGPALPKTATWASGKPSTPQGPIAPLPGSSDMPPLAASSAAKVIARKASAQKIPKAGSMAATTAASVVAAGGSSPSKPPLAGARNISIPGAAARSAASAGTINSPYSSSPLASSSPIAQRAAQDAPAASPISKKSAAAAAAAAAAAERSSAASSPTVAKAVPAARASVEKVSPPVTGGPSAAPTAPNSTTSTTTRAPPPGLGAPTARPPVTAATATATASAPAPAGTTAGTLVSGPPPGLGRAPVASATTPTSGSGTATPVANAQAELLQAPLPSTGHLPGDATPTPHNLALSASLPPKSSYRPSSRAQALLDDLRRRRAPELDTHDYSPKPSPFPDFIEATIESWNSGGEFCFNLHGSHMGGDTGGEDGAEGDSGRDQSGEGGAGSANGGVAPNGMTRGTSGANEGSQVQQQQDCSQQQAPHEVPFGSASSAATGYLPFGGAVMPASSLPPGLSKFGPAGAGGTPPPPGIPLPPGVFGMGGMYVSPLHGGVVSLPPNRSGAASPAISGYSGSFDPFASSSSSATEIEYGPGSSVTTLSNGEAAPAAPFAAIDEMRRTLSDEREKERLERERNGSGTGADSGGGHGGGLDGQNGTLDDGEDGGEPDKRASRFGFASEKRKDSVSLLGLASSLGAGPGLGGIGGAGSSPFFKSRLELLGLDGPHLQQQHLQQQQSASHLLHHHQQQFQHLQQQQSGLPHLQQHQHLGHDGQNHDLLRFASKDVSGLLGHMFENEHGGGSSQHHVNGAYGTGNTDALRRLGGGAGSGAGASPLAHFHQFGGGSGPGSASTPPPGFGTRGGQQQQQQQGQPQASSAHQQQQQSHAHLNGTSSSNQWLAKFALQQQAAANQAQGYSALDHLPSGQQQHQQGQQHHHVQHQQQHQQPHQQQHVQQQQHHIHGAAHSPLHTHSHLQHGHPHMHHQQQPGGFMGQQGMHLGYGNQQQQQQPGGFGTPQNAPRQLGGLHLPSLSLSSGGGGGGLNSGNGPRPPMNNAAAAAAPEPLLAQLMAGVSVGGGSNKQQQQQQGRRLGPGPGHNVGRYDMYGGDGNGDLSFMDPAIMSLTRNRQQQDVKAGSAFSPFG